MTTPTNPCCKSRAFILRCHNPKSFRLVNFSESYFVVAIAEYISKVLILIDGTNLSRKIVKISGTNFETRSKNIINSKCRHKRLRGSDQLILHPWRGCWVSLWNNEEWYSLQSPKLERITPHYFLSPFSVYSRMKGTHSLSS